VLWYVCGFGSVIINCFGAYCIGAWLHNLGTWISMHMSLNGQEHVYISIDWLHDLNALSLRVRR
jgi:hypothetical protein